MRFAIVSLLAATIVHAAPIPTPPRQVTDPKSLTSPVNPKARPVPIPDLTFSRGLSSVVWGADGKQIFVSTNLTGRYNIWRMDAAGSWPVQLTQGDDRQGDLAASPDGTMLYFAQDKGGNEYTDIYAVPTGGGAVTNLTNTPDVREGAGILSHDGKAMLIATKKKSEGQTNVALFDPATGTTKPLSQEADSHWSWLPVAWLAGDREAIVARREVGQNASEVWRIETATGKATRLLAKPQTIFNATGASPDGRFIALSSNDGASQLRAGVLDTRSGAMRWLKPTPWDQVVLEVSPDGRMMLVRTNDDARATLSLVDLATLVERPLPLPPGYNNAAPGLAFSPDSRKLLVLHAAGNAPSELVIADVASGSVRTLIRPALASLDPAILPRSQVVTYKSFDGTLVSAVVTMPFNLKRDGSNPAILLPHGGPTAQTMARFDGAAAALASRGYVTIAPNPRGSTGYGKAFQLANVKDLGGGDLKDEIAAKQFLVASGYVDARKVGITGGSYGGFMTLMAIGRTPDEFAAAVQMFGIINWRTMWEHEDASLQAYQSTLLGAPADNPRVYDASSPLTYLGQVKAPLLSLQGENDIRVPRGQAQEVTDALKARGNVAEVVFYPAEGHGFVKRENVTDSLTRMVGWFDRYLKGAGK